MTTTLRAIILGLGLLPGTWACARANYQYQPLTTTAPATAAPQLLFVSFLMSTRPPGPRRIELLKATAVPGEAQAPAEDAAGPNYLLVTLLDAAGRPVGTAQRLPHPLLQQVEYPAEGSGGRLERREVALPEAEFFLRLALPAQAKAVRVQEVSPATPAPVLATFPLTI